MSMSSLFILIMVVKIQCSNASPVVMEYINLKPYTYVFPAALYLSLSCSHTHHVQTNARTCSHSHTHAHAGMHTRTHTVLVHNNTHKCTGNFA